MVLSWASVTPVKIVPTATGAVPVNILPWLDCGVLVGYGVAVPSNVLLTTLVGVGDSGVIVTFTSAWPVELSGVNLLVSVVTEDSLALLVSVDCTTLLTMFVLVITVVIRLCSMTAVLVDTLMLVTTSVPVTSCVEVITTAFAVPLGAVPSVMPLV